MMIMPVRDWIKRNISDPKFFYLFLSISLGLAVIYLFGEMLTPVLVAVIIAYLLEGIILQLMRLKVPRIACVTMVFMVYLIAFTITVVWFLPLISREIIQLFQQLPSMLARAQGLLEALPEHYPELVTVSQVQELYAFISSSLSAMGKQVLAFSFSSVRGLVTFTVYLVLVPFLVFFLLKDKEMLIGWINRYSPPANDLVTSVLTAVNIQIANYIRGKGWEVLIVWAATWVCYHFIGVQYALLLSFLSGISVILPYIGVTAVFLPTILIGYFQFGWDVGFLYTVSAYSAVQLVDGFILAPLLLAGVVDLHPVVVVIAVLFFGNLWGIWGLFFAIPLATLVKALLDIWMARQSLVPDGDDGVCL
jgi:putative permease